MENNNDVFMLGGHEFHSRFILGSGKYNSHLIRAAVEYADAEIVTLALRRANTRPEENILDFIPKNVTLLPNTSGARNAEEAIRIARLARKMAGTDFVKVEIMRDSKYLLPDNQETIKATEVLANEGFVVMPYMYPDLNVARDLANAGAACIMPLASPIGSNKGLATKDFIQILIDEIDLPIIVDAGIGRPSQACEAMEMGAAAIMANTEYTIDNSYLSPEAQKRKKDLEENPASRTNHMEYMDGMEVLDSDIKDKVRAAMQSYDYNAYTDADVRTALANAKQGHCGIEDFKALLSPAALPHLEEMAALAQKERLAHFGDCVYIFTPLYIANYCENYCVYCGFNCYNHIHRKKLTEAEMEAEMKVIADSGIEEILMLTGESRAVSDVKYIGEACKLARKYFRNIGLEIYPVNTDEYHYLHECGADYITVFQETYNPDKYETLHLMGHKRVWPYRFDAQERALRGGMRGVGFSALLGLDDYHTDALATALHVYYLQRKYPHAEMSISCPRLRPIINNDKINPKDVHENVLCQILCAYLLFLPFAAITVSSREEARFRDGIIRIAATKISAGVSTGIGDHKEKYEAHEVTKIDSVQKSANNSAQTDDGLACANDGSPADAADAGDEQFEIADNRSFEEIYDAIRAQGMQPVLNDYLYTEEYHN